MCVCVHAGSGVVTIRKLKSKILFSLVGFLNHKLVILPKKPALSPARLTPPRFAQRDFRCGQLRYISLCSLFNPCSCHFLSSARCPVEIPSRHLIKVVAYLL